VSPGQEDADVLRDVGDLDGGRGELPDASLPPPDGADQHADQADDQLGDHGQHDQLGELRVAVLALTAEVQAHHARAEARERVIDNLHTEVERLRVGERSLVLRPVITDLQHLRGDLLRQAHTLPAEITARQTAELLDSFALSVELALERCGSVPVRPSVGEPFSAREHRATGLLPAERPEQDGTIGSVLADGYRDTTTDRVTLPAKVQVLRWMPAQPDGMTTQPQQSDGGAQQENAND
jgi:hypothetical protein